MRRLALSGTLLLPPSGNAVVHPTVPMRPIIEQLGYKPVWTTGSCKLHSPEGRTIRLKVRNGGPEVVESEALALISNWKSIN